MIEGSVEVSIGGETFMAAPLNWKSLKKLLPKVGTISVATAADPATLDTMIELIGDSLRRNHPQITNEFLEESLDGRNAPGVATAVMRASGLQRAEAGEQKPVENGATETGNSPTPT